MHMYEEHVRYHLICDHELCENEATAADPEGFHPGLNMEQLNKVCQHMSDAVLHHCAMLVAS